MELRFIVLGRKKHAKSVGRRIGYRLLEDEREESLLRHGCMTDVLLPSEQHQVGEASLRKQPPICEKSTQDEVIPIKQRACTN